MYADLNVPWPGGPQAEAKLAEVLGFLQILKYDVCAVNVEAQSVKAAKQVLATSFTPAVVDRLQAKFPGLRILRRATLVLDDQAAHPNVAQLSAEPHHFDVVAVLPRTEKQLQSCATQLDIDLICIETTGRLPFTLRHKLVGAAVKRGVRFEVCYNMDRPASLRHAIANTAMLGRAARSRGIVVSSGAVAPTGLRAPLDVVNLMTMWGLASGAARDSVGKAALDAATQGVLRAKSVKQAVFFLDDHTDPPAKRRKPNAQP